MGALPVEWQQECVRPDGKAPREARPDAQRRGATTPTTARKLHP